MTSPWDTERFGDVCGFVRGPFGGSLKKNIFKEDGYAVYEQQHAIYNQFTNIRYFIDEEKFSEMSRFELFSGDLIMSCSGTMGKVAIVPDGIPKGIINQALLKLSPKENLIPVFLKLWMQSRNFQEQIEQLSQGAAIKNMASVKILKEIQVPLPPINEQKRIVAILDQAFAEIERARANAQQNLNNARELFESYLQQVFSQRGDGWVEKMVSEVADLSRGQNPPKSQFIYESKEGYVRFYQIRDGKSDKYAVYVPKSPKLHYVNKDEILMVAYRHVGGAFRGVEGAFNVALCKITNRNQGLLHNDYLFHLIPSSYIKGELLKASERSLIPSMSVKHLAGLKIPVPPLKDQDEIVRKINSMEQYCKKLEFRYSKKIDDLDELKKSILQKAFSGELSKAVAA